MDKKRMKRMIGIAIPRALIITGISYNGYIRTHTFTLPGGVVKNELIQPINNKIKVSGNADTDVIFTDIESRKQYTIGYITHGMSETIQLEVMSLQREQRRWQHRKTMQFQSNTLLYNQVKETIR